jgi:hypothetical protein
MLALFVVGVIYSLTEAGFRMMSPVWIAFLLATLSSPQILPRNAKQPMQAARGDQFSVESSAATVQVYEEYV